MKRKLILADNQDITRIGMEQLAVVHIPDLAGCVGVSDKMALISALTQWPNAVVVLDYTLFDIQSSDELLILSTRFLQAQWILFSAELGESFIRSVVASTNVSMLLKDCSIEEILTALRYSFMSERYLCAHISNLLLSRSPQHHVESPLSPTEREVLRLFAQGHTAKEIAASRCLSIHTVISHKKNIFRKLEINNVYEATKYALRAGIIDMSDYTI